MTVTFYIPDDEKIIVEELAVTADVTSPKFRGNADGEFFLDVQANHGTGTQDLEGVFYLRHRGNKNADMENVDGYEFTAGPAGTLYRHVESFSGARAKEYDVFFDYSAGEGDITITLRNV